ncbi:MAG: hypothetical protein R2825_09120 [Saprospiraceae bacterium]
MKILIKASFLFCITLVFTSCESCSNNFLNKEREKLDEEADSSQYKVKRDATLDVEDYDTLKQDMPAVDTLN